MHYDYPPFIKALLNKVKLTDAEQRVVDNYAQDGHLHLNRVMRGANVPPEYIYRYGPSGDYAARYAPHSYARMLRGTAKLMKDAIVKYRLPKPIVTYRGTGIIEAG